MREGIPVNSSVACGVLCSWGRWIKLREPLFSVSALTILEHNTSVSVTYEAAMMSLE